MKISFIGHASILVEVGNVRILSDPWWRGPCFGAQWWIYPSPRIDLVRYDDIDYIYVSHGHHDHYHPGTLKLFNRKTKILVSDQLDLAESIRALGFEVMEVGQEDPVEIAPGCRCWIWPTYGGDSLSIISDGNETCVNANDALHAAPVDARTASIQRLRDTFPRVDYFFCGYGVASHFPNCYVMPGKDDQATATRRQHHFNSIWVETVNQVQPTFGFPFAADVVLLEADLQHINEPTHNSERPTDLFRRRFPDSKVQTIDIAPGTTIEGRRITTLIERQKLSMAAVRRSHAESIERANRYARVTPEKVDHIAELLRANIETCRPYLLECDADYSFAVVFRNSKSGVAIRKRADQIEVSPIHDTLDSYDDFNVCYLTRLPYLELSLSQRYGDEILFVGSGGVFIFRSDDDARRNLHLELRAMLRKQDRSPPSRFGQSNRHVVRLKGLIKRMLRMRNDDLYDLTQWVEWKDAVQRSAR